MPTRDEITRAVHEATGNPDTGAVHEITPTIIEALDRLLNPTETKTKTKPNQETRLMGGPENTRG